MNKSRLYPYRIKTPLWDRIKREVDERNEKNKREGKKPIYISTILTERLLKSYRMRPNARRVNNARYNKPSTKNDTIS